MTDDQLKPICADDVKKYLLEHPDFFIAHSELLENLTLPHESGDAISLVERQITLLRDRNEQMKNRHTHLLENARDNDRLFDKSKRLVLALIEANDLDDLIDALYYSFNNEFNIEYSRLVLFGNKQSLNSSAAPIKNLHEAKDIFKKRFHSTKAVIGGVTEAECQFIFGNDAKNIGSAAFSILNYGSAIGILAVGNSDKQFYHSAMGTLFLGYIAEVLNRVLPAKLKNQTL